MNSVPRGRRGKGKINRLDTAPATAADSASPPVPSLPMAVTGVCPDHWARRLLVPHLANKCGTRHVTSRNTCFLELLQKAEATPPAKQTLAQNTVVNHKECHDKRGVQPLAFNNQCQPPIRRQRLDKAQWAKKTLSLSPRPRPQGHGQST